MAGSGSRWIHSPVLHSPLTGKERRVGWLELFYDLVYVATIIQLGNALSEHLGELGMGAFGAFAALMVPLWLTWTDFTFYSNRFVIDDAPHRALVFAQMFCVAGMAVCVPEVMDHQPDRFVLFYVGARFALVALYARMYVQEKLSRDLSRRYMLGFSLGATLWLVSIFLPAPWSYGLWVLGLAADLTGTLSRPGQDINARFPPDTLHTTERYGLLTIIVLGESFVKVLTEVSKTGVSGGVVLMGTFGLLITCALWWLYFDDVAGSRIKRRRLAAFGWIYAHLPLTIAITAVGVAIKKAVLMAPLDISTTKYRLLLCGTLVLVLLSVAFIDSITERRQAQLSDSTRVKARMVTAAVILLMAFIGEFLPAWAWLGGVTAVLIVQVLFDISMAPVVVDHHHEAEHESHAMLDSPDAVDPRAAAAAAGPKRWDLDDIIRRGAPNELRRDFYVLFVEGSWTQVFVAMGIGFVLINLVFAALYMVEPWGVQGMGSSSFLDAFAFSVQTFATVGYGTMSPASPWAYSVSIVEAVVGLLAVALATGLMFAKASRPRSSVLFSDSCVINEMNGVPTLVFRAGNARGNEVVEAKITVTALIDEVTAEGEKLRKLHNLELVRARTPIFTMSWTVMHPITPDSPLHGLSPDNVETRIFNMVVNLTGHDATYASTTHARKLYYPEHFQFGRRFVDVIHTLDDGRLMVDYEDFHRTIPDAQAAS